MIFGESYNFIEKMGGWVFKLRVKNRVLLTSVFT